MLLPLESRFFFQRLLQYNHIVDARGESARVSVGAPEKGSILSPALYCKDSIGQLLEMVPHAAAAATTLFCMFLYLELEPLDPLTALQAADTPFQPPWDIVGNGAASRRGILDYIFHACQRSTVAVASHFVDAQSALRSRVVVAIVLVVKNRNHHHPLTHL